jgi:hypothetical protein
MRLSMAKAGCLSLGQVAVYSVRLPLRGSSVSTTDALRRPFLEVHDDLGHHLLTYCMQSLHATLRAEYVTMLLCHLSGTVHFSASTSVRT